MSQNARESLSALMDNEGDELDLRRVLKSLEDSPDAAESWRRYHLMRSLIRREPGIDVASDLSAGVMERLQEESLPEREAESSTRGSLPLARSAGIAAAVSLLVITGVQFYNDGLPGGSGADFAGGEGTQAAPASLPVSSADADKATRPSLVDLPLFQTPQRVGGGQGFMTVGTDSPMFMAPSPSQSQRSNEEQARLLQSYLDRHARGAAAAGSDSWLPLLRISDGESLGQR